MNSNGKDYTNLLAAFADAMYSPDAFNILGEIFREPVEKYPYEKLGDGLELRPITLYEDDNKTIIENRDKYSHLYNKGIKVSDEIFRLGGTGGKFKYGYCELIHYTKTKKTKDNRRGFTSGTFVIINESGKICLQGGQYSDHPHHIGGHIASIGNYIYDLRTGKAIAPKSSTMITGLNCAIIDHKYSWYDKEIKLPLGIYKIDYKTAEITLLDNVK